MHLKNSILKNEKHVSDWFQRTSDDERCRSTQLNMLKIPQNLQGQNLKTKHPCLPPKLHRRGTDEEKALLCLSALSLNRWSSLLPPLESKCPTSILNHYFCMFVLKDLMIVFLEEERVYLIYTSSLSLTDVMNPKEHCCWLAFSLAHAWTLYRSQDYLVKVVWPIVSQAFLCQKQDNPPLSCKQNNLI